MNVYQERRARGMVEMVVRLGPNWGFLVPPPTGVGMLIMRGPGAPYADVPAPSYSESDLENALSLNLLQKVNMKDWEYYITFRELRQGAPLVR